MKLIFGFFVLASIVAFRVVLGDIESCTDVSNCSKAMKNKCNEMSESLKDGETPNQKFVVACKNGICMCNVDFAGSSRQSASKTVDNHEEQNDEPEREED